MKDVWGHSGSMDQSLSELEIRHRTLAREAAVEGIVLLKNEGVLPLSTASTIALLGSGAEKTIKGGIGSGDVNNRENISIYQGMKEAGVTIKGCSHITGGGFYENIPRSIPDGLCAKIKKDSVRVLPIFDLIAKTGEIPERDMFNTFNMGVGMMVCVAQEDADKALETLRAAGEDAYVLGTLVSSDEGVILK